MAYGHRYTKEQDDFIRDNYSNVSECVKKFNEKFNTNLSYSAIKTHANRKLKLNTGIRPWTQEMNDDMERLLSCHPYKVATEIFNQKHGTQFTRKQVEQHCVRVGISRKHREKLKKVDSIIKENIEENTYRELQDILRMEMGVSYNTPTTICRRAKNLGLSRPRNVWDNKNGKRFINGIEVPYSVFIRFIGHRFHRLNDELKPVGLQIVTLQKELADKNNAIKPKVEKARGSNDYKRI